MLPFAIWIEGHLLMLPWMPLGTLTVKQALLEEVWSARMISRTAMMEWNPRNHISAMYSKD